MTHLTMHYPSKVLGTNVLIHILIPSMTGIGQIPGQSPFPETCRTLYLLHGAENDPEDVLMNTSAGRYADEYNLAVVIPDGGNSFWVDFGPGIGYETFLTVELIPALRALLPLSCKREDTFIGGYSMGGYGSIRIALRHPDMFSGCASLSGALDIRFSAAVIKTMAPALIPAAFQHPRRLPGTEYDLKTAFDSFPEEQEKPQFYFACGKSDFFCPSTSEFAEYAVSRGFKAQCILAEGDHNWEYWDPALKRSMEWFSSMP